HRKRYWPCALARTRCLALRNGTLEPPPTKGYRREQLWRRCQVGGGRRMVLLRSTPQPLDRRERTEAGGFMEGAELPPADRPNVLHPRYTASRVASRALPSPTGTHPGSTVPPSSLHMAYHQGSHFRKKAPLCGREPGLIS